jgi:hypothetical protein
MATRPVMTRVAQGEEQQGHATTSSGDIPMKWPPVLKGFLSAKSLAVKTGRGRRTDEAIPAAQAGVLFEDKTVAVSCHSRFEDCHFRNCAFLWAGKASGWQTRIFVNCTFDDCDYGVPIVEFLAFTHGGGVKTKSDQRLAHQQIVDEAVRRLHIERPFLVELSLCPSHEKARQQVADWVRAEYQKITAENAMVLSDGEAAPSELAPSEPAPSEPPEALPVAA